MFWLLALPIAGLAAAGAYLTDTVQQFAFRFGIGAHVVIGKAFTLDLPRRRHAFGDVFIAFGGGRQR